MTIKRAEKEAERKVYVTIRPADKRKQVRLETWRFWEIVGELQYMGLDRISSYDAAKWCARDAKSGAKLELPNGITMEVTADETVF